MIMSHEIDKLPFLWLGGGEVDVKWRVSVDDFKRAFRPVVANITSDHAVASPAVAE